MFTCRIEYSNGDASVRKVKASLKGGLFQRVMTEVPFVEIMRFCRFGGNNLGVR